MHLQSIYLHNKAPFDSLKISFKENEIAVLTAINGKGKTTILSYIADAFHEMAKIGFQNEYEGKSNKFYRVSNSLESLILSDASIAYLRFDAGEGEFYDYANVRGNIDSQTYDSFDLPNDKIPFNFLDASIKQNNFAKVISQNLTPEKSTQIFQSNLLTYFPSYRYEAPGYLNQPYEVELSFAKKADFSGFLKNPIEVREGLSSIANWMLDVVLDLEVNKPPSPLFLKNASLFGILNSIVTNCFGAKFNEPLSLAIGPRNSGSMRVQIKSQITNQTLYPSVFNISSGEAALLCIFLELVRQADNIKIYEELSNIRGVILIDEVDKHLHIRLQKEVLPDLFSLFPGVQFILSAHSPFLNMGLADKCLARAKIIDLDNLGLSQDPKNLSQYQEVYEMMVQENYRFKELYEHLDKKIQEISRPLVITEGKTDAMHIKNAMNVLGVTDLDVEFFDIPESGWGSSQLKILLERLSMVARPNKVIGIFDRDEDSIVQFIEDSQNSFKDFGNSVYGFCIPKPESRSFYSKISIEFYYSDEELKTLHDGKCLYFDNEIEITLPANDRSKRKLVKIPSQNVADLPDKKIYTKDVGSENWIHSKSAFADLVINNQDFSRNFSFSNFHLIFERLRHILVQ